MSIKLENKDKVKRNFVRFVIGGQGGVGKSTAVATIAKNPLVVDLDGRFPDQLLGKSEFLSHGTSYQSFLKSLKEILLEEKLNFDWLIFDTATKVMGVVEDWTIEQNCAGDKEKYNAYGFGLKFSPQYFKEILNVVDMIQTKHGINVAFVCHTKVKEHRNPMSEAYHKNVLDLPDIVAEKLKQWADYIGYAWFEYEVDKEKKKAKEGAIRKISFTESPLYEAKNSSRFSIPVKMDFDKEGAWAEVVFGKTQDILKELDELVAKFPVAYHDALKRTIEESNIRSKNEQTIKEFIEAGKEKLEKITKESK